MTEFAFRVYQRPLPMPRPQVGRKGIYYPNSREVIAYKEELRFSAKNEMKRTGIRIINDPVLVKLEFVFPRIQKLPKLGGRVPHPVRPDVDNLEKAVFDALNKVVWKDDSQIFTCQSTKWYASDGEKPSVLVKVRMLETCTSI